MSEKTPIPESVANLVADTIATHLEMMTACKYQAEGLLESETREGAHVEVVRNAALRRAVHELEASLHMSKLSDVALFIARLALDGYDVGEVVALYPKRGVAPDEPETEH